MKIIRLLTLSIFMVACGQLSMAQATNADPAELRQQIERLQEQIDELRTKIEQIETVTSDPKGTLESTKAAVSKLKRIAFSGYMQVRYNWFEQKENGGRFFEGFEVRRARIKMTAKPSDRSKAIIQIDAGDNEVTVKNAYATYDLTDTNEFAIGQMEWPFGYEVTNSSANREVPERALVFRRLFPGQRDRGAQVESDFGKNAKWTLGVFDGTGIGEVNEQIKDSDGHVIGRIPSPISGDENNHKDIVTHLTWNRGNAEYGVSGYIGKGIWDKKRVNFLEEPKDRYGAEYRYFGDRWVFKSEYVRGRGVDQADKDFNPAQWVSGYYAQLSYNTNPTNMLVARYSTMSQDPDEPQFGRRSAWDLGWLRWLDDRTRIRFFYQANEESEDPIQNNGYIAEWMVVY